MERDRSHAAAGKSGRAGRGASDTAGDWGAGRYRRDAASGVYLPVRADASFDYSDGDEVEERIAGIVASAADLSVLSTELSSQITDWPSLYHLSPRRANLLRPIEGLLGGRVLEVGAGCGALTRFLGECGARVVALEPSRRRATIAASRCRDLPNVEVVCERLELFEGGGQFDAVTLVGVLEYARLYANDADPVQSMLERARSLLAEGGHLVVAIENQLGLKYLGGYAEDHLDAPMHGIDDLYDDTSVVTFGRGELTNRLARAGFPTVEVHVPLPDYKLPSTTVMQAGTVDRDWTECLVGLVTASPIADAQQPVVSLFSLERAWRVVCRNGMLDELANSFLVVASPAPPAPDQARGSVLLAVHCGSSRRPEFGKVTEIHRAPGGLEVRRRLLQPEHQGRAAGVPLTLRLVDEPFRRGEPWTGVLTGVVNRKGWTLDQVVAWARVWLDALAIEAGIPLTAAGLRLPGRLCDATPFNLIHTAGEGGHFVDLEWEVEGWVELGWLLFRSLYCSFAGLTSVAEPDASVSRRIVDLVAAAADRLGLSLGPEGVDRFSAAEVQLQRWVAGSTDRPRVEEFRDSRLAVRPGLLGVEVLRAQIGQLERQIGQLERETGRLEGDLAEKATHLRARDAELESLREHVRAVEGEVQRLSGLARRVTELEDALHVSASELSARGLEVDRLSAVCAERELELGQQSAELDALRVQAAVQQARGARARNVLTAQLAAREQETGGLGDRRWEAIRPGTTDRPSPPRAVTEFVRLLRLLSEGTPSRLMGAVRAAFYLRRRAQREEVRRVLESGLFDSAYYLRNNADVARARSNPLLHFMTCGAREGRAPCALFDTAWLAGECGGQAAVGDSPVLHYLSAPAGAQPDPHRCFSVEYYLSRAGGGDAAANPLAHFLAGAALVSPCPLFDPPYYLEKYPDVAASGVNPLAHYVEFGAAEGRDPHPLFDSRHYVGACPDGPAAGRDPLRHWSGHGWRERRDPHPLFDTSFYLQTNPDVAASGIDPLVHFVEHGAFEGRFPHPLFDTGYYLVTNPDVAAAGVNPLTHFLRHGGFEGRRPNPSFDPAAYLDAHPELRAAGVNPLVHFVLAGGEAAQ